MTFTARNNPSRLPKRASFGALAWAAGIWASGAQVWIVQAQTAPDYVAESAPLHTELLPAGLDAKYDGEGFLFGLGVTGSYDSNISLSEANEVEDYSLVGAPWVQFRSAPPGGARFILEGRYAPFIRAYLDNDQLNSVDQSASGSLSYGGDRSQARAGANYSKGAQSNRIVGGRTDAERFTLSLTASHLISEKTSVEAGANYGYDVLADRQNETFLAQFSAFWQATPLIKLGPTVRYAQSDSDTLGSIETTSGLLTADYRASDLINVRTSAGLETSDQVDTGFTGGLSATYRAPSLPWSLSGDLSYARIQQLTAARQFGGGGDSQLTGRLSLGYSPNDLWALAARVAYQTIPSPTTTNQSVNDLSFGASISREMGHGSITAGADISFSEYEAVGPGAGARADEETYSFYLTHQMNLFEDRVTLDSAIRFSDNTGGRDWSRLQLSTGFNYTF